MSIFSSWLVMVLTNLVLINATINLLRKNACKHFWEYPIAAISPNCYHNPNIMSSVNDIMSFSNYPFENYTITTNDGYILTIFRIPRENAQPVYLQHGITKNSNVWVDKGNRSLAFYLYDKGYDVWFGDLRGTTYSRDHVKYSSSDDEYWNYNLDIMAKEDVPTFLEFIGNKTGRRGDIIYIGHSMGTTLSYMYASDSQERAELLLSGIISMSAIAYLDHSPNLKYFAPFEGVLRNILNFLGIRVFLKHERRMQIIMDGVCRVLSYGCYISNQLISGRDPGQFRADDLLLFVSSWLTSTSVDEVVQYLQIMKYKRLQKFDFGKSKNMKLYGQELPPAYNLSAIKLPVTLFYGRNDWICSVPDVTRLFKGLGSDKKQMIEISRDGTVPFNHGSFELGKDILTLFYPYIIETIDANMKRNRSKEES